MSQVTINNGAAKILIVILTGLSNYVFWSRRVQATLQSITTSGTLNTAWNMVGGIAPPANTVIDITPADPAHPTAAELSRQQEVVDEQECRALLTQQAITILINALPDNMLHHVGANPCIAWEDIQLMYGVPGPAAVYADYLKTIQWRLPVNADPAQSIAQLESLYMQMQSSGVNVPDIIRAMTLLSSVPSGMDALAQSLLANKTAIADLTWEAVRNAIQAAHSQSLGMSQASCTTRSAARWNQPK